jgi:hypothetical protein
MVRVPRVYVAESDCASIMMQLMARGVDQCGGGEAGVSGNLNLACTQATGAEDITQTVRSLAGCLLQ